MAKRIETDDKNVKKFKTTQTLKVRLTDVEILEYADQMARAIDNLTQLEEEKKAVADSYKAKVTEAEATVQRITNLVRNKYDYRPVDCEQTMDNNTGTAKTIRLDTGELIEDRMLTYNERQGSLFEEDAA